MSDVYDTLSTDNQAVVRNRLFAFVYSSPNCAGVDLSTLTTPASLADPGNRSLAVDCFQVANNVGQMGAGVLDSATYNALMATGKAPLSMGEKIGLFAVAGLVGYWVLKGKRGARGPRGRRR